MKLTKVFYSSGDNVQGFAVSSITRVGFGKGAFMLRVFFFFELSLFLEAVIFYVSIPIAVATGLVSFRVFRAFCGSEALLTTV